MNPWPYTTSEGFFCHLGVRWECWGVWDLWGYCGWGSGRGPRGRDRCWVCRSRSSGCAGRLVLKELRHEFEIVLDKSSVAALFALLIAVCCDIKSRNIVVVSSDAARRVASWLFSAEFSARRFSFCFVIFSILSDRAVRRSSVDTAGAAALACRTSRSPRTVASSMVNCATFAESCWNCSDVYCNSASAIAIAILTSLTDRVAFLLALHITINGIFELGVRERVPHVGMWSLSTADSTHFGHEIAPFVFENRSRHIFASSGEIVNSAWLPWPGVPGAAAACACAAIGRVRTCVWGRFDPSREEREGKGKGEFQVLSFGSEYMFSIRKP